MQYFTIISDANYLTRALVLIESLQKVSGAFRIFVLCIDDKTALFFEANRERYPEVCTIRLEEIEEKDKELLRSKSNRSLLEYFFTLSPCLPLYILKQYQVSHICSLDTDIKFYGSPQGLFDYLDGYSIIITPHKFSKQVMAARKYGLYNVSFQIFKNDPTGMACLEKWRSQCLHWCRDEFDPKENRYADQKYLDDWEVQFAGSVKILDDNVSGIAPWNLNNFKLSQVNECFYSNDEKLIFYHFHNHKFVSKYWAISGFNHYKVNYQNSLKALYKDYWQSAEAHRIRLQSGFDNLSSFHNYENRFLRVIRERKLFFRPFSSFVIYISLPSRMVSFLRFINRLLA